MRRLARHLALAVLVVWSLGPILVLVLASFKLSRDIFVWPPELFSHPTALNYVRLWTRFPTFFANLGNSAVVAESADVVSTSNASITIGSVGLGDNVSITRISDALSTMRIRLSDVAPTTW